MKTQFAPLEVHIAVVALLKRLAPYFEYFDVEDEGDFFETEDISVLEDPFRRFFDIFDKHMAQSDRYYGPVRLQDGRIIDIMEKG